MTLIPTSCISRSEMRMSKTWTNWGEDVFAEYNKDGDIIGIEIWQARKNVIPEILDFVKVAKQT